MCSRRLSAGLEVSGFRRLRFGPGGSSAICKGGSGAIYKYTYMGHMYMHIHACMCIS